MQSMSIVDRNYQTVLTEEEQEVTITSNDKRILLSLEQKVHYIPESSSALERSTYQKASVMSSFTNLVSTIIGAGILAIPYAISMTGFALGIFLLAISAILSWLGLYFLSESSLKFSSPSTFNSISNSTIPKYATLVDIVIAMKGIGIATSYLIIIGDSISIALSNIFPSFTLSRSQSILLSYVLILPLSYFRSLDSLKFSSAISLVMIGFLSILIVLYTFRLRFWGGFFNPCREISKCRGSRVFFKPCFDNFRAFTIFLFSFTCQQNTFTIVNELKSPTRERLNRVFTTSIGTAFAVGAVVGCCGYATFGDGLKSDILLSYPNNSIINSCRLLLAVVVACHYPLQLHPSRKCAMSIWEKVSGSASGSGTVFVNSTSSRTSFIVYTMLFNTVTFFLASMIRDFGYTLSLLGATSSVLVIFLLPGFYYYKLTTPSPAGTFGLHEFSLLFVGIGLLVLVLSLVFICI